MSGTFQCKHEKGVFPKQTGTDHVYASLKYLQQQSYKQARTQLSENVKGEDVEPLVLSFLLIDIPKIGKKILQKVVYFGNFIRSARCCPLLAAWNQRIPLLQCSTDGASVLSTVAINCSHLNSEQS